VAVLEDMCAAPVLAAAEPAKLDPEGKIDFLASEAWAVGLEAAVRRIPKDLLLVVQKNLRIQFPASVKPEQTSVLQKSVLGALEADGFESVLISNDADFCRELLSHLGADSIPESKAATIAAIDRQVRREGIFRLLLQFSEKDLKRWAAAMGLSVRSASKKTLAACVVDGKSQEPPVAAKRKAPEPDAPTPQAEKAEKESGLEEKEKVESDKEDSARLLVAEGEPPEKRPRLQ